MARLSLLGNSVFVAIGVVAAVTLLPISKWSVRNQIEAVLQHGKPWGDRQTGFTTSSVLRSVRNWNLNDRHESLARALAVRQMTSTDQQANNVPYVDRPWFRALSAHSSKFPEDVEALAAHARLLCMGSMVKPATEVDAPNGRPPSDLERERKIRQRTEIATALLHVASLGSKLEPDNLYFSLCRTMALNVLGRFAEARLELYRGAGLTRFEDYASSEGDVLIRVVEQKTGYRGEAFRTATLASTLLPHFASIRGTVTAMRDRCPANEALRLQWALFRCMFTLARDNSTYIAILVGKGGMNLALAKPGEFQFAKTDQEDLEAKSRAFHLEKASVLASKLRSAGQIHSGEDPSEMLEEVYRLEDAGKTTINTGQYPIFENLFRWPSWASRVLMGLVGFLAVMPFLRKWSIRFPESYGRSRGAASAVAGMLYLSILANVHGESLAIWALLGAALFLIATLVLAKGIRPTVLLLAIPMGVLAAAVPIDNVGGVLLGGMSLVGLGAAWLSSRWTWLATVISLIVFAMTSIVFANDELGSMGPLMIFPLMLIACCLQLAATPRWFDRAAAATVFLLASAYGFFVIRDVIDNARLKELNASFVSEADRVRQAADLPRLSADGN